MRAQCEGDQDLRIDVNPISADRARELLEENPNHFPGEPDQEAKLWKLQTLVELAVYARTEFRVRDASHARRVVQTEQSTPTGPGIDGPVLREVLYRTEQERLLALWRAEGYVSRRSARRRSSEALFRSHRKTPLDGPKSS